MKIYKRNKKILENSFNYNQEMEHDACGVGLIASTNGKKSRKIIDYGIQALKSIWHRGAVDADGKSGYQVTIYDRYDRPGGLLIYGIPNFKLEKFVVERRT